MCGLASEGDWGAVVAGGKENALTGQISRRYEHGASRSTLELVVRHLGISKVVAPEVMIGNILILKINPINRQ